MTATTGLDPIEAIEASPIPYSMYREVHKGLRLAIFDLVTRVGSADYGDSESRIDTVRRVHELIAVLHAHHDHEDRFMQPLILTHAATLAPIIEEGHTEIEADLVQIELCTDRLEGSSGGDAVVTGLELYGRLSLLTASYLAHMGLEEGGVMAALLEATSIEELFAVDMALRSSVAPPTMCQFIAIMMPAMNVEERTNMLGGMKAGAPPEIFELFRSATETALKPDDYRNIAIRIALK